MKYLYIVFFGCFFSVLTFAQTDSWKGKSVDFSHGKLVISSNGHYLTHTDGTPFFYLGDTAWELFHRLDEEEVEMYLENRRTKGFTVILAVILAETDGLNTPDRYGEKPLLNSNPEAPNIAYFNWVDKVIRMAAKKGLYMGILPTWGDKVDKKWGIGPEIFNQSNAYAYGEFLGKRYKDYPNIIWINGGDRSGEEKNAPIWDALAEGIKSVDKNHLMTFHPLGEASSSNWFHNRAWLDFNACQTSHEQRSYDIYRKILVKDYHIEPAKPCMDMEPHYEGLAMSGLPDELGRFDGHDIRNSLYWSLFSGACGYTYGGYPIWLFTHTEQKSWMKALDMDGACSLVHARRLLESYDYFSRQPDQSILTWPQDFANDVAVATRGNGYAFVYLPNGHATEVSLEKIPGARSLKLQWFNPRTGKKSHIATLPAKGKYIAQPTEAPKRQNDWILIMEADQAIQTVSWNPQTTDWNKKLCIGDWGIDRPGYPKGLYIEGITVKEKRKVQNPVIYDNDVYNDVIDDEWMFAMSSLGKLNLVGQILTPVYAEKWKFYWGKEWIDTALEAMVNAYKGGIDMKKLPPIIIGTEAPDEKSGEFKDSEGARLYVKLINYYYKKNPKLPVIINIGGQGCTLASAWGLDNSIAEKCIVYYTDLGGYNGDYAWASELVAKNFRVINFGSPGAWWRSKLYQNEWNVFPRPEYPEANQNDVNSGEWRLFTQTGNYMLQYIVKDFFKNRKEICLKGWKADGYCDGTFIHAWLPGIFSDAELQTVRGGEVLQITQFEEENEKLVKQFTMNILLNPNAYLNTSSPKKNRD